MAPAAMARSREAALPRLQAQTLKWRGAGAGEAEADAEDRADDGTVTSACTVSPLAPPAGCAAAPLSMLSVPCGLPM